MKTFPANNSEGPAALPSPLAANLAKSHLPSLDGLRAIAAFSVVFYHCGLEWVPGDLGVLAFLVISGFLITWLLLKEEEKTGALSLKLFYLRRSLRLFPAFYVYWLLATAILLMTHKRYVFPQALASFFYVNNYYQGLHGDPNTWFSHTWSLGIEEQFYLLWPLLFMLLKGVPNRLRFLMVAVPVVILYREILVLVVHANSGYLYEAFETRADHLLIGCLLAVALRAGVWKGLWRSLCYAPWLSLVTLGLLVLSHAVESQLGILYRNAVSFAIDPMLIAILIVQLIAHPDFGLGLLLNTGWMRYLGIISYSVYLYQQAVVRPIKNLGGSSHLISLPLTVLAVIVVASASYWIVERPFLRLKKRFEIGSRVVGAKVPLT